jgi:hypothetical protein
LPEEIITIDFDDSAKFILFIGTPRSGHSIVGAILDAHPLAIISHEVNALERISEGVKGEDLFSMIIENSANQSSSGRGQSEADLAAGYGQQLFHRVWRWVRQPRLSKPKPYSFDYEITGQSQGIIGGPLRVIGDKKGGATTKILSRDPNLLRRLQEEVELPLFLIHVIRDPYDNISTMARRTDNQIRPQIRGFGRLLEQINSILEDSGLPIYRMYHEDFVSSPEKEIREICKWLNLPTDLSFIDACSSIVYEKPHRSRDLVDWDDNSKASVEEIISSWPILHRYSDKNS